jgi:hypothetical protein
MGFFRILASLMICNTFVLPGVFIGGERNFHKTKIGCANWACVHFPHIADYL